MTPGRLHPIVLAIGAALLAAGVVGVAAGWPGTGLAWVFGSGLACVLLSLVADRIVRLLFKHGNAEVEIGLASQVTAELAVTGIAGAAAIYSFVHNQLGNDPASGDVKVQLQDQVVQLVRDNAFATPIDGAQIDAVLAAGSNAERVLIFAVLQANAHEATLDRLEQGIRHSRSGNEQYHALLAAKNRLPAMTPEERAALCDAVNNAPFLHDDTDRRELAEEIC